jgi:hypothetical protein
MFGIDYLASACKSLIDKRHLDLVAENARLRERIEELELDAFWKEYSAERIRVALKGYARLRVEAADPRIRLQLRIDKIISEAICDEGFGIKDLGDTHLHDDYTSTKTWSADRKKLAAELVSTGEHFVRFVKYPPGYELSMITVTMVYDVPIGIRVRAKSISDPDVVKFKAFIERIENYRFASVVSTEGVVDPNSVGDQRDTFLRILDHAFGAGYAVNRVVGRAMTSANPGETFEMRLGSVEFASGSARVSRDEDDSSESDDDDMPSLDSDYESDEAGSQ